MRRHLLLVAGCALAAALSPARADTIRAHTFAQFGRYLALQAYDTRRHRIVQIDGEDQYRNPDESVFLFDPAAGAGWSAPAVLGTGPTTSDGSAVYDSTGDRVLVFVDEGTGVWSLSCSAPMTWQALSPSGVKPVLAKGGAIYDPVRNRVVGFGGATGSPRNSVNVTWSLSLGATPAWSTLATAGGTPQARDRFACAFDPGRDRMVVHGGETVTDGTAVQRNDVMALSFAGGFPTWNAVTTAGTPPSPRNDPAVVLDTARDDLVVFAGDTGSSSITETFLLPMGDATPTWQKLTSDTFNNGRHGMLALADPVADRMVIAGGSPAGNGGIVEDAWQLAFGAPSPAWSVLPARGSVPQSPSFVGYDPGQRRFVAEVSGPSGIAPWFLSLADSEWTPTLPSPHMGAPLKSFYDWRRGVYYAVTASTLYSLDPAAPDPVWVATPIGGTQPITPDRELTWFYDDATQRFLMFGGIGFSLQYGVWSNQFAVLSLAPPVQWTIVSESSLFARVETPAVLDRRRNRLLLFGGANYSTPSSPPDAGNGLWQVDLGTLAITQLSPTGIPPSPRYAFAAAYDSVRDRLIVFGGGSFNAPAPGLYDLQFGPSDPQGAWSRNDPVGADLPGFFGSTIGDYDAALDEDVIAGTPTFYEIQQAPATPVVAVSCPPRTAWAAGTILPLQFQLVQGVNAAHDYSWRVDGARAWPGFPLTGTQHVSAAGSVPIDVGIPVPDSVAAGLDSLTFTVYDQADPSVRDSCGTMIGDATSPVLWGPADVAVDGGSVLLDWWIAASAGSASIERREDGGVFTLAGSAPVAGDGHVRFVDAAAVPGTRYAYRAGIRGPAGWQWSDETWVNVPANAAPVLAFAHPGALVVAGALDVAFTLPRAGEARLEAFDVSGRRVAATRLDAAAGGPQAVRLASPGALRPGIYFLRLTQGAQRVQARALVLGAR